MALNMVFACDVLLICWFGTQLTHQVRVNGLLLLLFLKRHVENAGNFQQIRKLELLSVVDPLCILWPLIVRNLKVKSKFHNF